MKNFLISTLSALLFIGCGGETKETIKEEESAPEKQVVSNDITVQVKGVYATSTKMPQNSYGYEQLFDGNENTFWATMPGAGPDEGIMIYFEEPQKISGIRLKQKEGDEYSEITNIMVYANGNAPVYRAVTENIIELDQEGVKSLYIRLARLKDMNNEFKGDTELYASSFDRTKSAAVTELEIFESDNKLHLLLPLKMKGKVSATSTLEPEISYGVRNLFDSRKEFAWVEGAKGNGENESFTVNLEKEIDLVGIKISNGFQRSDKHFTSNSRLKSMKVSSDSGDNLTFNVVDKQGEQVITFDKPLRGSNFTFTILEAYPGSKYQDLVISELKLIDNGMDVIVREDMTETIINNALSKVKGTVLENVIDRRLDNNEEMVDYTNNKSIILRSDYTFVAYQKTYEGNQGEEIVADGNWEIKDISTESAKIRVFGKYSKLSETFDYYGGDSQASFEQIFQDFITITSKGVEGGKFIPGIVNLGEYE
ncbi:discoidin domain-containing protein [Fulvivirga lutea]|uniref:Discoidin domain-containing protein n=1 Tax=Fulvivirga lutea TaxID=2810512 RepID=A0A975A2T5_9BACT|nr:discoidin domain-containing protein [Fulvivirga lutea]QSE99176.1 discoidin domain-containing protein [Fulvivirga lutea]